ncbi:MAG: hypothetical protein KDC44_22305, partial [Phaeodactylibacter sp.]|nr:hypothetical protein [Phaeodactylibacter sp.]
MRPIVLTLFLGSVPFLSWGQFHQPVLSDLSGQELIDALADQYRPAFTLSESNAKDTLYARIYAL